MSARRCPNCQTTNRLTARFCSKCGMRMEDYSRSSQSAPQVYNRPSPPSSLQSPFAGNLTGQLPSQSMLAKRYIILQKVGQGGMGAVYKSLDTSDNKIKAIKEMSTQALGSHEIQEAITAFEQEANLLQRLNHPCLPAVSDMFSEGGRHYLVMEFIDGETLGEKIDRGEAPFREELVVHWSHRLCDVLAYLHQQTPPIVFRDLKPDNIMITRDGDIKLIDFGIVRFFKPGKNKDTTILGTPGYAAPEQFGSGQTDRRSDVYSLGATMFHLLTGTDPGDYELFQMPPVRQINPKISRQMEKVVAQATQIQSTQRWYDMRTMQNALPAENSSNSRRASRTGGERLSNNAAARKSSRPTTRLLLQAARYSNRQLMTAAGAILLVIVIGTWLLTPALQQIPWFWNNVPTIAIVGPFAFAATRQRKILGVAHAFTAMLGGFVVYTRIGHLDALAGYLVLGAILSGVVMAGIISALPAITGYRDRDDPGVWQREVSWLALTAIVGHIALAGIATSSTYAFNPVAWISAAILGAVGWFLGDLVQGYLYLRQTNVM